MKGIKVDMEGIKVDMKGIISTLGRYEGHQSTLRRAQNAHAKKSKMRSYFLIY